MTLAATSSLYGKPHQRDVMKLRKNRIWEHPPLCNPPGREDTFSGWGPPLQWMPASAFHIKLKSIPINFDVANFQWPFGNTNLILYCWITKCFRQKKCNAATIKAYFRLSSLFLFYCITDFVECLHKIGIAGFAVVVNDGNLLLRHRCLYFLHALHKAYILLDAGLASRAMHLWIGGHHKGVETLLVRLGVCAHAARLSWLCPISSVLPTRYFERIPDEALTTTPPSSYSWDTEAAGTEADWPAAASGMATNNCKKTLFNNLYLIYTYRIIF